MTRSLLVMVTACALWMAGASTGCAGQTANMASTSPAGAVTTVAVAAVATAAVGCTFQGCPYGSYCNTSNGLCEERKCSEGCPNNTVCNEGLNRCQAPGPPKTPNDFLPQDNPWQNYTTTGTHQ
jgi:hypothetical protein